MNPETQRVILGRDTEEASYTPWWFVGKRVLVTGAAGSIGEALCPKLAECGAEVWPTDIGGSDLFPVDYLDVTDEQSVRSMCIGLKPDIVYHLAAQKHAPEGEEVPFSTTLTNVHGTHNVWANRGYAKFILASTCKAIHPETVYGASKLLAERMVLNGAEGSVVRLFNVVPASGNVFEKWEGIDGPVPVTECYRYFISMGEAVAAFLAVAQLPPGRWSPWPGKIRYMPEVAADLGLASFTIPPRRGDRIREPLCGLCEETNNEWNGLMRVVSHHDLAGKVREPV